MPRDGVRQPRAQHDKLMLPFGFRRAHGTSYGVIEASKLALGAAVHIAHANHHGMRLIVQVQAVGNQLLQFDLGEAFKGTPAATTGPAFMAAFMTRSALTAAGSTIWTPFTTRTATAILSTIFALRPWRPIPARPTRFTVT